MKKFSLIILFFGGMMFCSLNAQTNVVQPPPSDAVIGYTYDFDSAKKLVIDRQIHPSQANMDVQPIIDSKDFPKLGNANAVNEVYVEKLKTWMEKNPNVIIETLKARKEVVHSY